MPGLQILTTLFLASSPGSTIFIEPGQKHEHYSGSHISDIRPSRPLRGTCRSLQLIRLPVPYAWCFVKQVLLAIAGGVPGTPFRFGAVVALRLYYNYVVYKTL